MQKGKLIVISGPSGVGKGTVVSAVTKDSSRFKFSVSATTRDIRPGEKDGVNYHFLDRARFEELLAKDAFLEHTVYAGEYYGTLAAAVRENLDDGYDVILEIEVDGALQVKKKMPDAVLIFIMPPSWEELERRLRGRGDTPEEKIKIRLATARNEVDAAEHYDYLIVNDILEDAVDTLKAVLNAEEHRAFRCYNTMKEAL